MHPEVIKWVEIASKEYNTLLVTGECELIPRLSWEDIMQQSSVHMVDNKFLIKKWDKSTFDVFSTCIAVHSKYYKQGK